MAYNISTHSKAKEETREIVVLVNPEDRNIFLKVTDPMCYPLFNPHIEYVERINENTFAFHEKISLLLFSYRFSYDVLLRPLESTKKIILEAEVQKGVHLKLSFAQDESGIFQEVISVSGPFIIRKMLINKVVKAHRRMIQNIEAHNIQKQ